jgi:hypothetical protein
MNRRLTRRNLFTTVPGLALASGAVTAMPTARAGQPAAKKPGLWAGFPRQDAKLVSEVVGQSHANEARVRELVKGYPELVNACWDWGFGDWETALGAASHTGQRGIAEFLLEKGARIDIFAAAMLGMTSVVKGFVAAQPGIQRTLGPHGIPLLAHAKAGGKPAADTLAYLESLGDAGTGLKVTPMPEDRKQRYLGEYASKEPDVKLVCRLNKARLLVVDVRAGEAPSSGNRVIHYLGDDEFFTAGVASVRIRFAVDREKATSVTIRGSVPEMTLGRTGG